MQPELTFALRHRIDSAYFERKRFAKKKVEDIIGGDKQWENVDKTEGTNQCRGTFILLANDGLFSNLPQ